MRGPRRSGVSRSDGARGGSRADVDRRQALLGHRGAGFNGDAKHGERDRGNAAQQIVTKHDDGPSLGQRFWVARRMSDRGVEPPTLWSLKGSGVQTREGGARGAAARHKIAGMKPGAPFAVARRLRAAMC